MFARKYAILFIVKCNLKDIYIYQIFRAYQVIVLALDIYFCTICTL